MPLTEPSFNLFAHTLTVLEWSRLVEALASHARSSLGALQCRESAFAPNLEEARRRQQETMEMTGLQEGAEPAPSFAFPDVREALSKAGKGAVLEGPELRDHAAVFALWEEAYTYVSRHRNEAPALAAVAGPLHAINEVRDLRKCLDEAIHADGSVKESATPDLRRLTHHANELRQQMRARLDDLLQSSRYEEVLQERYFDQREGRYVLPIKAEMEGRVAGIVHDVSSSGATVFLEPRELVDLNNAIKIAEREINREVMRILRELSSLVASHLSLISAGIGALAQLDGIAARGRLAKQLGAHAVALNDRGVIRLKEARHPLLALAKEHVVANDLALDEETRVLIISGPNTGGKTATLKMVGLFALMARSGLLLPCAPGSEMALFPSIYADIGDAQDLTRDLSSFSAHMIQMIALLNEMQAIRAWAPSPRPGQALVLLDEPVTSTDPTEGAALAAALLCRLAAVGSKVIATTHYGALKTLAQTTRGFANASVEFDVRSLSPTYRLFMGVPAGSSAIDIAGRLGMDAALLEEARRKLEGDDHTFDDMLRDLHDKQRRLADDLARAAQARREAEEAARLTKEQLARLEATEWEERRGIKKKLQEQFSRAKAEMQATIDAAKRDQQLIRVKEAKQRLIELEAETRAELEPPRRTVPVDALKVGDAVEMPGLGMVGTLLESPVGKKRVRVKVGEGEVSAAVGNLIGLSEGAMGETTAGFISPPAIKRELSPVRSYHAEDRAVIDVRGKAADEALDEVMAGLDRATLSGVPMLRVIHGHGTGRLKSALRQYLLVSPYVERFRPGDRSEGGDGVTVITLR
ncbi:MAG TPA: endonuclease MutS2 [Nitrospira sp.]|nr:endonuclease MutS2 [Nitrospira sp.]